MNFRGLFFMAVETAREPVRSSTPAMRKRRPLVGGGLVVVIGAVVAIVLVTSKTESRPDLPAPQAELMDTVARGVTSGPPNEVPPDTVTITLAVEPPTATVELDGSTVTTRELTGARDDTADHTLTITAPAFLPHTEKLRFHDNQRLVIDLERAER